MILVGYLRISCVLFCLRNALHCTVNQNIIVQKNKLLFILLKVKIIQVLLNNNLYSLFNYSFIYLLL